MSQSATVSSSKLLSGLDDSALRHVLSLAQHRKVETGRVFATAGARATHLYIVKSGRGRFFNLTKSGEEVVLTLLVPGDVVGLVTMLANPPGYFASAAAISECELLVWDHATMRKLTKAHPQIHENGLRLALQYLRDYMQRHVGLVTNPAEVRLAQALLYLAEQAGEVRPAGVQIDITNEHLSSLSDTSPFTTSRVVSQWAREGKIAKSRGKITLRDPESLLTA